MFDNLLNKTVLVTGASSGIGAEIARQYAKATNGQIKLVLVARREAKVQELATELNIKYPGVKTHVATLDVSDTDAIEKFYSSEIPTAFLPIDILVNNAGKALGAEFVGDIPATDVAEVFQTNVIGMIAMTQVVLKDMKRRNKGDIVQLGLIAGRDTYPGGSIYCSSKAAVKAFTDTLRKELVATGIRVLEVVPGNTETEFALVRFKGEQGKAKKTYEGMEPLKPLDVADMIVYATSRDTNVVMAEVVVMASSQAGPNHVYRH